MRRPRTIAAAITLALAACDAPALRIEYCEDLAYTSLLATPALSAVVYAGNRDGRAPAPVTRIEDPARVASLSAFLLDRRDLWYLAAGETYDPRSRRAISDFTVELMGAPPATEPVAAFGFSGGTLETPGCGFEVVRPINHADYELILNLIFERPRASIDEAINYR